MVSDLLKPVPGYPHYLVSDSGEVYSLRCGRFLKQSISKFGYARCILYGNGKKQTIATHRLVAMAYLDNPNNYPQVNHKNENRLDNRVENLEWCTSSYNINYGNRNATVSRKLIEFKTKTVGRKINQIAPETKEIIRVWDSVRQIERETGIAHSNIYNCCIGKRKTRGGYIWEYAS